MLNTGLPSVETFSKLRTIIKKMTHVKQLIFLLSLAALPAHAGYIAAKEPLCITLRSAKAYNNQDAAFNQDLIDRAACYLPAHHQEVTLLQEENGFVKVLLLKGHKMWALATAYQPEKPENPTDIQSKPLPQETTEFQPEEPQTWYQRLKAYLSL